MLTLLLVGVLSLAFKVQPVKSADGITIAADGAIDPETAPILRDGDVYTFTADISDEILVEKSNVIVDGNGHTLHGSSSQNGFTLNGVNNVEIRDTDIRGFMSALYLQTSSDNIISGNTITDNYRAISLYICYIGCRRFLASRFLRLHPQRLRQHHNKRLQRHLDLWFLQQHGFRQHHNRQRLRRHLPLRLL